MRNLSGPMIQRIIIVIFTGAMVFTSGPPVFGAGEEDFKAGIELSKKKDYAGAFAKYSSAAEAGNAEAMTHIAFLYQFGNGVEKDHSAAMKWHRKAADAGSGHSMWAIGYAYMSGRRGVGKDSEEAVRWYIKAGDHGYLDGYMFAARMYRTRGGIKKNLAKSFELHRKAADRGHVRGMVRVGMAYRYGKGVEKDLSEALKWYRQAADKGNTNAMMWVGDMYGQGLVVEKDVAEKIRLYKKAAREGNQGAMLDLGLAYYDDLEVKRNIETALQYFQNSHEKFAYKDSLVKIWMCLNLLGRKEEARRRLIEFRSQKNPDEWVSALVGYLLGEINEEQLLDNAKDDFGPTQSVQQGNAFFCIALTKMLANDNDAAILYFQKYIGEDYNDSIDEHRSAKAEIGRLRSHR